MKKEKLKKGDRVLLKSRFDATGVIGNLIAWRFSKESGIVTINIKPDKGLGFYFMGRKNDFTMEKLDE